MIPSDHNLYSVSNPIESDVPRTYTSKLRKRADL